MRALALLAGVLLLAAYSFAGAGHPSPADWRDQTFYQILTDRFFDGDPSNNAVEGYYDPSDGARNHGGDWAGIEEKLDYIAGLGATAIWISPVQVNAYAAYHGYHIRDFYRIAPHFGGPDALRSLIDAAHARGMYVILDVIANHGGDLIDSADPDFPDFHDPGDYVLRWRSASNKHAPPFDNLAWFHNNGGIDQWVDPNQILGELSGLDDFRTEEPAVRDALIDAHRWLIDSTDADGFRIDTVKHVELDFWQDFAPAVHAFAADSLGKERFFLYGEIFDGSSWKNGIYTGSMAGGPYALDSVLWFPMYFAGGAVFRDGAPTAWLSVVNADSVYYDPSARARLVHFLDNHDVGRFMGFGSNADRDDAKARTALAWSHTSLGIPCVYYGTEQEFDGGGDPYNREDMWDGSWDFGPSEGDNFDQTAPLYRWLRRLNELRRDFPALQRGAQLDVASSGGAGLYAYKRTLMGEASVLVAVNTKAEADTLTIDPGLPVGAGYDLLSGRSFPIPGGAIAIVVGGLSAVALSAEPPSLAPWIEEVRPAHDASVPVLRPRIEIAFTEPMDGASVESRLDVTPAFAYGTSWRGNTLLLSPAVDLANLTTYTIAIGAGAKDLSGDSLGVPFASFFRTSAGAGPIAVPAGTYATPLPTDDLDRPLSLERGENGRIDLADRGKDRIFRWNDRGFVEALVIDSLLSRTDAMARDHTGGRFDGDLLLSDASRLLRYRTNGRLAGLVESLATLPTVSSGWALAVDTTGAFGGLAYVGAPGKDSIWSVSETGMRLCFASGLSGVRGLAISGGGDFGRVLYATGSDYKIFRVDSTGARTPFASDATRLAGATALAFDPTGDFGGDLFVANPSRQEIVRVDPAGAVTTFATGFSNLQGPDCLAFDGSGSLYALEGGNSGDARVVRIAAVSTDSGVPDDGPPARFLLGANAPNPFNAFTRISYSIPRAGRVVIAVHDIGGALVKTILDENRPEGAGEATWDGTDSGGRRAASGLYLYRLRHEGREETRRMALVR